jgi:hypothetical protein
MDIAQSIQQLEELNQTHEQITKVSLWHDDNGWSCGIEIQAKYEYRWEMEDTIIDAIRGCIEKFKNGEAYDQTQRKG